MGVVVGLGGRDRHRRTQRLKNQDDGNAIPELQKAPASASRQYAYLEGEEGVQITTEAGFDVEGVKVKARLDFGAGFVDWRGWYTNAGA